MNQSINRILMTATGAALMSCAIVTEGNAQMGAVSWSMGLEHSMSSDMDFQDNAGNAISYQVSEVGLSFVLPMDMKSSLISSVGYKRTDYDFKTAQLWDDSESISGSLLFQSQLSDRWSLLALALMDASYENGADFNDSISWGVAIGGKYAKSDTFSWLLGVGYFSRLEDDSLILPIAGFEWQVSDRFMVSSLMGLSASYDLTGDGSSVIEMGMDFNLTDMRLKDDGADNASRAIRPEGVGFYIGYHHQLTEWMLVSCKVTAVSEQKFETRENGKKTDSFKTDGGVVGSLGLTLTF